MRALVSLAWLVAAAGWSMVATASAQQGVPTPIPRMLDLPPAPPGTPIVTDPQWLAQPTAHDFARHYPDRARARDRGGQATLECMVNANGSLTCVILSEEPPGWGFGEAALRLSASFRIAPNLADGRPSVGARLQLPIAFSMEDAPAPPPPVALPPIVTSPPWLERPAAEHYAANYPERALVRHVGGRVMLDCIVQADGRLACTVDSEDPPGWGFGDAALRVASHYRMATETTDGRLTEAGRVRVPIRFAPPRPE